MAAALEGLNFSDLARRSQTTPGFISLLFHGQRGARVDTLGRIAAVLKVSLDDLHIYLEGVRSGPTKHGWKPPKPKAGTTPAAAGRKRPRAGVAA